MQKIKIKFRFGTPLDDYHVLGGGLTWEFLLLGPYKQGNDMVAHAGFMANLKFVALNAHLASVEPRLNNLNLYRYLRQ